MHACMHMVLAAGIQGCSAGTCVVIARDLSPVSLLALGSAGGPQHLHHTRHWTATRRTLNHACHLGFCVHAK